MTATRGTSNGNASGGSHSRRRRRAWIILAFASDVEGFCRCYRCGCLLYNPDDHPDWSGEVFVPLPPRIDFPYFTAGIAYPLTIDRIIPGCEGGTYRRNNIRPACGPCNSKTGGSLWATKKTSRTSSKSLATTAGA